MKNLFLVIFLCISFHTVYSQDGFIQGEPALAYWKVGSKAETIIVLHGGPSVAHQYLRPEFDAFSKVAKVIYYDQRGCGKSKDAESYIWQEHVKDLKRVIDTFSKGKKVILAGSSWGSSLAMIYAYSNPEDIKALILSGTVEWPGKEMEDKEYIKYKAEKLTYLKPATYKFIKKEEQILPSKSILPGAKEKLIIVEKELEFFVGDNKSEAHYSLITGPFFNKLNNVRVPILIFFGNKADCEIEDWALKYAGIFTLAKLRTIKGVCHDPWLRDPTYFFSESKKFIRNLNKH
ncbi:alpha/beta hydrolase [Adhaeribacter rhizoryzae]|uniref:Alpha/beta fold hydrolase n=1 Tax=Adhaeribacter rhizoryzae TaxID=2607907 RepID=A0A5M6D1W0_9BACT|nr:alpha/beta fold hydrolase [Adhaeribacter rhizoryzae]KAA5539639.1 alpha/beta fold hydrolase [Adhaeribacter rhizoryzae]